MDKSEALNRHGGGHRSASNGNRVESRKGFRSLICDESGIIIGEMVYRCLICSFISESMDKVRNHYQTEHVDIEDISNGQFRYVNGGDYCPSPENNSPAHLDDSGQQGAVVDEAELEEPVKSGVNGGSFAAKSRSGYITCRICNSTRFYSYVQRRYGQFTCSACYRHFREFLLKPKVLTCPKLGSCSMDAKNKCKACWLLACINVYNGNVGEDKQGILETYKPIKDPASYAAGGGADDDDDDEEEDKEMDKDDVDGDDIVEKDEFQDIEGLKDEESESEMTGIKPIRSISQDQDDGPESAGEEEEAMDAPQPKRNVTKSKIYKKVNSKRKRNWSCMKCTNCLKQECGKCIYCLDRPKYGGQFRLRQRCANRRCLLKLKDL